MYEIPPGAPTDLLDAFRHVAQLDSPSVDDLKVMVMLEAAGPALYEDLAAGTDREDVRAILRHNGREEMAHARRLSKVVRLLSGSDFRPPEAEENPYLRGPRPEPKPLVPEMLLGLAETEFGGEDVYEKWASHCSNAEAAALMRQNGREETGHGQRLQHAAALLAA